MGLKAAGLRKVWVGIVVFIALFCTALAYPEQSRDSGTGKQVVASIAVIWTIAFVGASYLDQVQRMKLVNSCTTQLRL